MKKGAVFLCLFAVFFSAAAQVTQEQLNELQKKLQKQRDSVLNLPHVKKYLKNPEAKFPTPETPARAVANTGGHSAFEKIQLPKKDSVRLKNIPKKVFSPEELRWCNKKN